MPLSEDEIPRFYEECYEPGEEGDKYHRWRELCALGKADHVERLVAETGVGRPKTVADIGCGNGAVLDELGRRDFGDVRVGWEISGSGAELARRREGIDEVGLFDGERIPVRDGAYDLAFASHVLEHIPDPTRLVSEMLRVARAVVVEVPLEDNLSARRPSARAISEGVGHLQRFDRRQVRELVTGQGGLVRGELLDPLPREIHLFDKTSTVARARGTTKWAIRSGAAAIPPLGVRLFTMHFALLAVRPCPEVAGRPRERIQAAR